MADVAEQSETVEQKKKRREKEILAALFLLLLSDTDANLRSHISAYLYGSVSLSMTAHAFAVTLASAHAHAAYLGRRLAGVTAPFGHADQQFGSSVAHGQVPFATRLMQDLENGRYLPADPSSDRALTADGELLGDLPGRISLYVKRLRGTSGEAWALSLPPDTLIYWRLDPRADHCESCLEFAKNSPYRADSLPTTPGSADCECLSACRCRLETEAGEVCFVLPEAV